MPAKRILFGFLLCLALWLVVLAAQALTLGTEKSLFPYRTDQVVQVVFRDGNTGAEKPYSDAETIRVVMDRLHAFSPEEAVPNAWEGWTYGIWLSLDNGQDVFCTLYPDTEGPEADLGFALVLDGTRYFSSEAPFSRDWLEAHCP